MPFIVTTSRPAAYRSIGPPTIYRVSRQAVATLPDAQRLLRAAVRDADWPRDIGGSNARQSVSGQIDDLMASGGNAIRLPDGTVIEVVAVDDAEYARAIDAGMNGPAVPGRAEGRPVPDPVPIRGRWTVTLCNVCGERIDGPRHQVFPDNGPGRMHEDSRQVEVVPVPDEAAIERGAEAARKIPPGARNRWQRVAEAVLRAALEPPA